MPTGYTSDLYEGKDVAFPDFVMKCARAFGPLMVMRDEPLDATIPDKFEPNSYHMDQLEKAEANVARIKAWDDAEADRQAQLAYDRAQREYEESLAKNAAIRERYEAMLAQVKAWAPPSELQKLKDFMVKQLEESIEHDCDTDYLTAPERLTGASYREQELHSARLYVSYHTEHGEVDMKQAEERTNWVKALLQSLSGFSSKS